MTAHRLQTIAKVDRVIRREGFDDRTEALYQHLAPHLIGNEQSPTILVGRELKAPGLSVSSLGLVMLDGSVIDPSVDVPSIDVTRIRSLAQIGAFHGVAIHELGHQRHSAWTDGFDQSSVTPNVLSTMLLLEESRMESQVLRRRPQDRRWLMMAVRQLLAIHGFSDDHDPYRLAALMLARVDAGVLDAHDVSSLNEWVSSKVGPDTLAKLAELWKEAQQAGDNDAATLADIARRWLELQGVDPEDRSSPKVRGSIGDSSVDDNESGDSGSGDSDSGSGDSGDSGSGDSGDSDSDNSESGDSGSTDSGDSGSTDSDSSDSDNSESGDSGSTDSTDSPLDVVNRALDNSRQRAEESIDAEAAEQESFEEQRDQKVREKAIERSIIAEEVDEAARVFGRRGASRTGRSSYSGKTRPPTMQEKAAARELTKRLQRLAVSDVSKTKVWSENPAGRISTRRAMQRAAQLDAGKEPTVQMWRSTHRSRNEHPKPVVGLAVDVSSSMVEMSGPMASMSWIIPHAFRPIGGRFAAVTFGTDALPLTAPGRYPDQVPVWTARDGTEAVGSALVSLSGALPLYDPTKVRVVVICSDNYWFDRTESELATTQIARLRKAGVTVVSVNSEFQAERDGIVNIEVPNPDDDPMAAVRVLGDELVRLMNAAR